MDDSYHGSTPRPSVLAIVSGVIVVLVILFFAFCFRSVPTGEVGVITRFGKVNREAQSGVVLKLPFPIERLNKLNIQVQKEQQDSAASTADLQDVNTTLALNYHLDPTQVSEIYRDISSDYKVRLIDPAIQEAFKATSANFTATDLLTKRPEVKEHALQLIKARLEKRHIIVDDLSIINFKFSADFTASIEAKQVAQQNAEKAKYDVQRATLDAQANAVQQAALTPEILEQQAIKAWNGVLPTTVAGGSGTIFNIPLTK